jgi:hypothetical protein
MKFADSSIQFFVHAKNADWRVASIAERQIDRTRQSIGRALSISLGHWRQRRWKIEHTGKPELSRTSSGGSKVIVTTRAVGDAIAVITRARHIVNPCSAAMIEAISAMLMLTRIEMGMITHAAIRIIAATISGRRHRIGAPEAAPAVWLWSRGC